MKKWLNWLDDNILKVVVVFLIAFIPLYPKFPLLDLKNTWVYIRWDDIVIALSSLIFGIQVLRWKVTLKTPLTKPIALYWIAGLLTTIYALFFILGSLPHVFPNLSVLHYLRRIEYMVVFFIAFNSIKSKSDVKLYLITLCLTVFAIIIYAVGQRFAGFPAVITMNEEFAKGKLLYLPPTARITATFAGHYDLAAYMVLVIPVILAAIFSVKRISLKIGLTLLSTFSYIVLLFTESRVSIAAYFLAVSSTMIFMRKKLLLIPILIISFVLMNNLSGSSERLYKTFRIRDVAFNMETGQPIAAVEDIDKETGIAIAESQEVTKERLPVGSGFIGLPGGGGSGGGGNSAGSGLLSRYEPSERIEVRQLTYKTYATQELAATGGAKLATVSGRFLIRKALVYDISFTTRFQGEWPRAMDAFRRNPILGSGFSTISLATDNDYYRMLGETGILGTLTFLGVFFAAGVVIMRSYKKVDHKLSRNFALGIAGGIIGLAFNALLIDVFEASKIAYTLWILMGLGLGALVVSYKGKFNYLKELIRLIISKPVLIVGLLTIGLVSFLPFLKNYFTGDDFTWLRWAAEDGFEDSLAYFLYADGFFYRPLQKLLYLVMFNVFWLQPMGYHFVSLVVHLTATVGVYLLSDQLIKNRRLALVPAFIFLFLASNSESIFWASSLGNMLAVMTMVWSTYLYSQARLHNKIFLGVLVFVLNIIAMLAYEGGITAPLLLVLWELIYGSRKIWRLIPNLLLMPAYVVARYFASAHGLAGDYNYNWLKLPVNVVGNALAYLVMFVTGPRWAGDWFNSLRYLLNSEVKTMIAVTVLVAMSGLIFITVMIRRRQYVPKLLLFGIGYSIIALMPFLGLGNVSIRYSYLAAPGFAIVYIYVLKMAYDQLRKVNFLLAIIVTSFIFIATLSFNYRQLGESNRDWVQAGEIVQNTLLSLKNKYFPFASKGRFYFVDRPIRYGTAWVFPVGLADAFWHSWQDPRLEIHEVSSIGEGFRLADTAGNSYVFIFRDGKIELVKHEIVKFEKEFVIVE